MRAWSWSTPRAGAFARTGKFFDSSNDGSLADAPQHYARTEGCCVPNTAAVRFKKPATDFPARASTVLR